MNIPEGMLTKCQIWAGSLKLYRGRFFQVYFLSLLLGAVPLLLGSSMIIELESIPSKGFLLATIVAWVLIAAVSSYAVYHQLGHASQGQNVKLIDSLNLGMRNLLQFLLAGIAYSVFIIIGFALIIFPGLYLLVALIPFFVVIVMESSNPWVAFKRSRQLIRKHWWRTFSVVAIPAILVSFFIIGIEMLKLFMPELGAEIILYLVKSLVWPFFVALHVMIWHDLKQRN